MQHLDSLDTADQVDFTRRLAIEFAEVDGCYETGGEEGGQTRAPAAGERVLKEVGAQKEVSRTICRGGVTSQVLELQNVCRDCLFVCVVNESAFMHDMGGERTVEHFVRKTYVQADILEKRYRVAGRRAGGGREHPVRGGACKTARDEFEGY